MGLFSALLEKLGLKKTDNAEGAKGAAAASLGKTSVSPQSARPSPSDRPIHNEPPQGMPPHGGPGMPPPGAPPFGRPLEAMPMVDVVGKLDQMAKTNPEKLDWKTSIVDMLKLVGLDSSLAARKEMAQELGCPANLIGGDYSQMNIWLHKEVLRRIAENGGNIPQDLLKK